MPKSGAGIVGESRVPRIARVRRLAIVLQRLLKPTAAYRPVIGEADRRKVEILAFGLDHPMRVSFREALVVFGIIEPAELRTTDGASLHKAWIVQPLDELELRKLGASEDEDDEPAAAPPTMDTME